MCFQNINCYGQYDQNKAQPCRHRIPTAAELFLLSADSQYYPTVITAAAALWPHMFNHIYSAGNYEGNGASQPELTVL